MADNNDADTPTTTDSLNNSNGSNNTDNNSNSGSNNSGSVISNNDNESLVPKPKMARPRTTRVKPGRLNTDAINPDFVKTVDDWVSYYERNNVRLGPDGTLQVVDNEGMVKTVPFQKGFDAIIGVTMRLEILRKNSTYFLANLRQSRQQQLAELEDSFVQKEKELLEATQQYRETSPHDDELAGTVVQLNAELTEIHKQIQQTKYASQEPVQLYPFQRGVIQFGTHDESIIMINQPMNMETTVAMRTLGLNGEKLQPVVADETETPSEEDEDENGNTDEGTGTSTDGSNNESTGTGTSTDGSNNESTDTGTSTDGSNNESAGTEISTDGSNNGDKYFDELVEELATKLKTFKVPEGMTARELKSALFTEERLVYYSAHIEDFNKKFREAYAKAATIEEDTA